MNKIKTATWDDLTKPPKRKPRPKPQATHTVVEDYVAGAR